MLNPCFDNYIGISGVCNPAPLPPSSGKFIQDLEGISTPFLSQITDSDDVTIKQMVTDAIERGIEYALLYFKDGLNSSEKVNIQKTLSNYNVGQYNVGTNPLNPTPVYLAPNGLERGVKIVRIGSPSYKLSKIFIKNITLLANYTGAANLKISDVHSPTPITLIPITLVAGVQLNTELNYTAVGNEVYVVFDLINQPVADSRMSEKYFTQASGGGGGCNTCGTSTPSQQTASPSNNYLNITGFDGTFVNTTYLYGMKVNADLICDDNTLFCEAKTLLGSNFASYVLYSVGMALIEAARLNTDRFNHITIDIEALNEQNAFYIQKMLDLRKRLIKDFLPVLNTIDRQCVVCQGLTLNNKL